MTLITLLWSLTYFLATNWKLIDPKLQYGFNFEYMATVLIAIYFLGLGCVCLLLAKRSILLMSGGGGLMVGLWFVIITWLTAAPNYPFPDIHRYLTIPTIGYSLFIAAILCSIIDYLKQTPLRRVALSVLIILLPLLIINIIIAHKFFNDEIHLYGMSSTIQDRQKSQMRSQLPDYNQQQRALFYFDYSHDLANASVYETALLAGFDHWMVLWDGQPVTNKVLPTQLNSFRACVEQEQPTCWERLKDYVEIGRAHV